MDHIPQPKWKGPQLEQDLQVHVDLLSVLTGLCPQGSGLIVGVGLKVRCCESWKLL